MDIAARWQSIVDRAGLKDTGARVLSELVALYSEGHRRYHDLRHIVGCLSHLDDIPIQGSDTAALEWAIWFHDAIYSPLGAGNERKSADLARDRLSDLGADGETLRKVPRLIMATTHNAAPIDLDEAHMIDIDLAVLGGRREDFEAYESAIRYEYRLVPGPLFRRKRKAILQSFLARPTIFNTGPYQSAFETRARSNLEWAISRL